MAYAISIRSDNDSSDPIRALWGTCGALESSPSMEVLRYPPHITLVIYDEINMLDLVPVFEAATTHLSSTTIRFESLGYFEAPHAIVLWAVPTLPDTIPSAHKLIHSKIDVNLCRPHYRPGSWVPHCSLATSIGLPRRAEAIALASRPIDPFEVTFDVADCVSFPPIEVLHEKALPSSA